LFVDRYTYDQCKIKKSTDKFFSSRLDYNFRIDNYKLSNVLFYEILECIKIELNLIFKKNFDQKFYEIIIGAWLRKFIQQFILKYKNIIEIKKIFNIQNVKIYNLEKYNFFTSESHTIQHATINNLWNSCIYSHILSNLNLNIRLEKISTPEKNFNDNDFLSNKTYPKTNKDFKKIIKKFYVYLINLLPNKSNVFLYITGFGFSIEKKINLRLFQMPRIYPHKFEFHYSNFDKEIRKNLNFEKFTKANNKNYDQYFVEIFNLIIKILDKSLPLFIVEDFNNLINFSEKLNFPKHPKIICTSYAFESNEPFKFYLAIKKFINPKIKYFVYQHGGSYITRLDNSFNNECNTCDYFITWGNKTDIEKKNNIKFVNFKLLSRSRFKDQKLNTFLILTRSAGYNAVPYDRYSEGLKERDLTVQFCKKLSNEIKKNTLIRAHHSSKYKNDQIKKLTGFKIDYCEQDYFKVVNSAKLILFNHDSTGMLEMFAINKPTLCMWPDSNQHQNTYVLDDYELLKNAKILFDNSDELYKHLIEVWSDPLKWWYSDKVQKNLNKFVNLYTKMPDKNFARNFIKIIDKNRI
jgi:putative transferase (TIGR04331 family)